MLQGEKLIFSYKQDQLNSLGRKPVRVFCFIQRTFRLVFEVQMIQVDHTAVHSHLSGIVLH